MIGFNQDVYLVNKYTSNYFEGWYVKLELDSVTVAVIMGVSIVNSSDKHSFIQVFSTDHPEMFYTRFKYSDFDASTTNFAIKIKDNILTSTSIYVDVAGFKLSATIKDMTIIKRNIFNHSIMGPVQYLPKLECFHSIIAPRFHVDAKLTTCIQSYTSQGLGYLEKDYGTSMPKWWIWTQMVSDECSFMLSYAKVRYLNQSFNGNLGFLSVNNQTSTFASYKFSFVKAKKFENTVIITGYNVAFKFKLTITCTNFITLKAPVNGVMNRDIDEALNATAVLEIKPYFKKSKKYNFAHVSLELVGDIKYEQTNSK